MKKYLFTKEGYDKLLHEKQQLEEQRVKAVTDLSIARDMGDRSENAAYKYARQKLSGIDRQLRFLNQQLRFAHVIEPRTDGIIGIGSKVTIDDGKTVKEYTIVGGYESDIVNGRISQFAPLGKALMGKKVGDTAHLHAPIGTIKYQITNVI
jgi:transcription elongation factor GreA